MQEGNITASGLFAGANKMLGAYHTVLLPICRETDLPPMAVDILLFFANNPENNTASDVCRFRGLKSGIVSVHIDRLVTEGLLTREVIPGDRRKMRLAPTGKAQSLIGRGRELQKQFGQLLLDGIADEEVAVLRRCMGRMMQNMEKIRNGGFETGEERN